MDGLLFTLIFFIFHREDSRMRVLFIQNLVDDRSESVMSYYEFLVHLQKQISK